MSTNFFAIATGFILLNKEDAEYADFIKENEEVININKTRFDDIHSVIKKKFVDAANNLKIDVKFDKAVDWDFLTATNDNNSIIESKSRSTNSTMLSEFINVFDSSITLVI
jgi:hypothetical protein